MESALWPEKGEHIRTRCPGWNCKSLFSCASLFWNTLCFGCATVNNAARGIGVGPASSLRHRRSSPYILRSGAEYSRSGATPPTASVALVFGPRQVVRGIKVRVAKLPAGDGLVGFEKREMLPRRAPGRMVRQEFPVVVSRGADDCCRTNSGGSLNCRGNAIGGAARSAYVHHRRNWAAPRVRLMFTVARCSSTTPLSI